MKRRIPGRHRAPMNLPRPVTGTATVAASGLLAATLGAATAVPAPPATAFDLTSPSGSASAEADPIMTDQSPTHSLPATIKGTTGPATDLPAQAVPAPAPDDLEQHSHFGELGFTGLSPEPVAVSQAASASEGLSDAETSAAQARDEVSAGSRSEFRQAAPVVPPANNQGAEAAIAWAQANLGLPYSWGSSSGGAYDCSGFTTAAFRAAGISIPHQSEAQYHATSRVSLSDIQRGDLLFYSNNGTPSGIFHVAIYLGDGQVIHSLRDWSGWDGSKINGIHYASGLMGAGRP